MKEPGGYTAEGTFAFEGNICQWQSKVTDVSSKEGEFNAQCPNGIRIDGDYTYASNGSSGFGVDNFGRSVKFTTVYTKEANQFTFKKLMAEISATSSYIASSEGKTIDEVINRLSDSQICQSAKHGYSKHIQEAKRRGLTCGVGEISNTQIASSSSVQSNHSSVLRLSDSHLVSLACQTRSEWSRNPVFEAHVEEAQRRGLSCSDSYVGFSTYDSFDDKTLCALSITKEGKWNYKRFWYVKAAKYRGLTCGVNDTSTTQIASATTTQSNTPTSAELTAAQKEAERLRQELAALKAQQEQQQQTISSDNQIPLITIASADTQGKQGVIRGRASDNVGVAEITASGQPVPFDAAGNFQYQTFVPTGGKDIVIEVTDVAGLTSKQTVSLTRSAGTATVSITFDSLNPLGRRVATNKDALALIIGVDGYENTPARAIYADSDAQMFADYATEKLGIPANRIKTLVNDNADFADVLLSVREWLGRSVRQNKTDVHIFFAGHGLASDDGEKMYLLPYDGSPRLLDRTAILRDELFADISAANPRSVTVFLDTCYSGTTRGTDMLIASRPIAIRALEQSIPDNFTVMTAAAGDQTAKPLEEAKHGMFSYFLMKGMEGEADANNDNEITAGELHSYVQTNVMQQSSGSQTPELQGDADRVLVRFQ